MPIRKLLIANRGEIACRVARSARALGIATVAVHSDVDQGALHAQVCDEAVLLGAEGQGSPYLDVQAVLAAAQRTGADAVHPGYGFLAERADFARAVQAAGLTWVGPSPEVMDRLGRKDAAKALARSLGVPVVPGFELGDDADLEESGPDLPTRAATVGYPLLLKAVAGGGGRGMRVVREPAELEGAVALAEAEARAAFGDGTLLVERYVEQGRHVEVQILADAHGTVLHLGERECSIQRRHQKLVEEAPSPAVDAELRERLADAAVRLARGVGYVSAGTVEFLLDAQTREFFFLEVNTRIQVEHPVSELVASGWERCGGLDLVAWQLRIAQGEPLPVRQADLGLRGHAIEVRLCAEDPLQGFGPQAGPVRAFVPPAGEGVRVDHGLHAQDQVPVHYDAMVAKIVAWGPDRPTAIQRLQRALRATVLHGPLDNRLFLLDVLADADFAAGDLSTRWLDSHPPRPPAPASALLLVAAALWRHGPGLRRRFRSNPHRPDVTVLHADGATVHVALQHEGGPRFAWGVSRDPDPLLWRTPALGQQAEILAEHPAGLELLVAGERHRFTLTAHDAELFVQDETGALARLSEGTLLPEPRRAQATTGSVVASGSAVVAAVHVEAGQAVTADTPLVTLEAMKMLTVLRAPVAGLVRAVLVRQGENVGAGTPLVDLGEAAPPA